MDAMQLVHVRHPFKAGLARRNVRVAPQMFKAVLLLYV